MIDSIYKNLKAFYKEMRKLDVASFLFLLWLWLLPFSTCFAVPYWDNAGNNYFVQYIKIFLTDSLLIFLLGYLLVFKADFRDFLSKLFRRNFYLTLLAILFLSIGFFRLIQHDQNLLNIHWFVKCILFVPIICYFVRQKRIPLKIILIALVIPAILQSLLAISQFLFKESFGLTILGENRLGTDILGVAKFKALNSTFIRAYGTFFHPNILAYYLGLIFFVAQDIKTGKVKHIFIVLLFLSLLTTLSRINIVLLGVYFCLKTLPFFKNVSRETFFYNLKQPKFFLLIFIFVNTLFDHFLITDWQAICFTIVIFGYFWQKPTVMSKLHSTRSLNTLIIAIFITINMLCFPVLSIAKSFSSSYSYIDRLYYFDTWVQNVSLSQIFLGSQRLVFVVESKNVSRETFLEFKKDVELRSYNWQKQPIHNAFFLLVEYFGVLGVFLYIMIFKKVLRYLGF